MADDHKPLWNTLAKWVERAKDPSAWHSNIMAMAAKGPRELTPYQRGMVAHVISSIEGAKKFAQAEKPPPAEWLLVLDKDCRYEKPFRDPDIQDSDEWNTRRRIDPHSLYRLDSDPAPALKKDDRGDTTRRGPPPADAWDAFNPTHADKINGKNSQPPLRGPGASDTPELCARLRNIAVWISRVAFNPVTLWWISQQSELHPFLIELIERRLDAQAATDYPEMVKAWRYLFEAREEKNKTDHGHWYQLIDRIENEGWSGLVLSRYLECLRPRLSINSYSGFEFVLSNSQELNIRSIIAPAIFYPNWDCLPHERIELPAKWVPAVLEGLRYHLHTAIQFELDKGLSFMLCNYSLVEEVDNYPDNNSLFILLWRIKRIFELLVKIDIDAAKKEYGIWQKYDSKYFLLLRFWVAHNTEVVPCEAMAALFAQELDQELFWSRNFLFNGLPALQARWSKITKAGQLKIEDRIIKGPDQWSGEDPERLQAHSAGEVLDRLHWLHRQGCTLNCDLGAETRRLKKLDPQWTGKYIEDLTNPGSKVGIRRFTETKTDYSELENVPIKDILAKAEALRAGTAPAYHEAEPFQKFAEKFPVKAFLSLRLTARDNKYPEWAWSLFLNSKIQWQNKPRFVMRIAVHLSHYPDVALEPFIYYVLSWLKDVSSVLIIRDSELFYRLFDKMLGIAKHNPMLFQTNVLSGKPQVDWVAEAINSPVGFLLGSLFEDLSIAANQQVSAKWLARVHDMLQFPGDLSRYTLAICTCHLEWFYAQDAEWTRANLLSAKDSAELKNRQAFRAGVFEKAQTPGPELYRELKDALLAFDMEPLNQEHLKVHAVTLLTGWKEIDETTGKPYVSNTEFREFLVKCSDEYRTQVLREIRVRSKKNDCEEWQPPTVSRFLTEVWPKQSYTRSPAVTTGLCELAFSSQAMFEETAHLILPHLVKLNSVDGLLSSVLHKKDETDKIIHSHPELVLTILDKTLPDEASGWPYPMVRVFDAIEEADPALKSDKRMVEIRRKWDSR